MEALKTAVYLLNRVHSKAVPKTPFKLWTGRKPSLRHLHVWGCPAEARIYNPHEKKLDFKTISDYFIAYPAKSKGYRFYCPTHSTKIVETGNARFLENGEISDSDKPQNAVIQEVRVQVSLPITSKENVVPTVVQSFDNVEQVIDQSLHDEIITNEPIIEESQGIALRRSQRERRSAISDDYVVYLQESNFDIGTSKDPVSFLLVCNWLHSVGQNHFFVMMILNRDSAIQSASRRFCIVYKSKKLDLLQPSGRRDILSRRITIQSIIRRDDENFPFRPSTMS